MTDKDGTTALVTAILGVEQSRAITDLLTPMMPVTPVTDGMATRAQCAAAMNMILFANLLDRVPSAAAYVHDKQVAGEKICFDHGAIRTIALCHGDTGALPRGELAFRRILEPLGYEDAELYPLPTLRMTGRAYRHMDFPSTIPQFFVSELHVDQFDADFGAAAERVFSTSRDPLDAATMATLSRLTAEGVIPFNDAVRCLPLLISAFDRQHEEPSLEDYDLLKQASKEAAWIATEGNAFNHATDRVDNVVALSNTQKALGRPMKEKVEFSRTGRVRQTAFRADMVERHFRSASGASQSLMVPGSFYEFISRDTHPDTGTLDLSFDSGNATGIFHMTKTQ